MKAAIFTINTRMYKEKKNSSESAVLTRLLEQVGLEVKSGVLPEDRAVVSAVMRQLSRKRFGPADPDGWGERISEKGLCAGSGGRRGGTPAPGDTGADARL